MATDYSPSRSFSWRWPAQWPPGLPAHQSSNFRSGREAIFALAQQLKPNGSGRVLLPAWVAEGVHLPFQVAKWEIDFYNLDHNADPVWEEIQSLSQQQHYDLVFILHYFGQERDTKKLSYILPSSTQLVEDWAHSYPHVAWKPPAPTNWALFSPTKIVGTTDGAWLIGPTTVKALSPSKSFISTYLFWQLLYLIGSSLQQLDIPGKTWWTKLKGGAYTRAYRYLLQTIKQAKPMSSIGKWLIKHTPHEHIIDQRKNQAKYYFEHLIQKQFRFLLSPDYLKHPLIGFPIWVENPRHFADYLHMHGIKGQVFTDRWWFISPTENEDYKQSKSLMEHHFLLPINQRFTKENLVYITQVVNRYNGEF